jgi:protein arginine kinase activator
MQCENCGIAEATIQLTTVVEDETRVLHLCERCAAERGVEIVPAAPGNLPLAGFLAQIGAGMTEPAASGRCSSCGLTATQLKQTGRLGCSACYQHYEQHLRGLLRRLHGVTQHAGKVSVARDASSSDLRAQLDALRRRLQHAVDSEDFEHAAALRDQIRRMESTEEVP